MPDQSNESIALHDASPETAALREDALAGLRSTPRGLPSKLFYDEYGSQLFEQICEQPEYYPTRTELQILQDCGEAIAREIGPKARVVEFGTGSGIKTKVLLESLNEPAVYAPMDISKEALMEAAENLKREFPDLVVQPFCADWTADLEIPEAPVPVGRTVVFFPGSSIGNLAAEDAVDLLARMRRICGEDGRVLLGLDQQKDVDVLEAAYDDAAGVTAAFNLNQLTRINEEFGGSVDLEGFRHVARYVPEHGRIEMRLSSRGAQTIELGGETFEFVDGEEILTEYSHKYTPEIVAKMAERSGMRVVESWFDADRKFAVVMLAPR